MTRAVTLLVLLLSFFAWNTYGQSSRLRSWQKSEFINSWNPTDSVRIIYLGNNGGDIDDYFAKRLKYDTVVHMKWDGSAYQLYQTSINVFDIQGRVYEEYLVNIPGSSLYDGWTQNTYDVNGNLLEKITKLWMNNNWRNYSKLTYNYDGNNNMLLYQYQSWDNTNSVWKNYLKSTGTYALNGNRLVWAEYTHNNGSGQYDTTRISRYHYNGNLCDTLWENNWTNNILATQRRAIHYYQGNTIDYIHYQSLNGMTWENISRRFTLFHNNIYAGDSLEGWNTGNNTWYAANLTKYFFDNNDSRIALLRKLYNSTANFMENYRLDSLAYNVYNQKTWEKNFFWDDNAQSWILMGLDAKESFYYYEEYANDVKNITSNTSTFEIYPSPANNNINIRTHFETPEDFKVQIYDMQGRLVFQIGEKATKEYNRNIPLHNLPSGNYILQIAGSKTKAQEQFPIIK